VLAPASPVSSAPQVSGSTAAPVAASNGFTVTAAPVTSSAPAIQPPTSPISAALQPALAIPSTPAPNGHLTAPNGKRASPNGNRDTPNGHLSAPNGNRAGVRSSPTATPPLTQTTPIVAPQISAISAALAPGSSAPLTPTRSEHPSTPNGHLDS